MRAIAAALGCRTARLGACVRGMRADLCLTTLDDSQVRTAIRDTAWTFVHAHLIRCPAQISDGIIAIASAWDQCSIADFYRLLHLAGGTRITAAWFPYEVSAMERFYAHRAATGSRLSPLDRLALESFEPTGERPDSLRRRIREISGVDFDFLAASVYRYLLAYGTPTLPTHA
jgi:hypothetical protein